MYGPTEATVWASIWRVRYGDDIIVESPVANTQLYVLDTDLSPVPLRSAGGLYIGGAGVARGYHNNPKLTCSRFLQNPFRPGIIDRTGDVVRFNAPGKLSVLGRTDDQLKIRGFRIEPSDTEAAITGHASISRALVISLDDCLVAYCVRATRHAVDETQTRSVTEWARAWDHVYGAENHDALLNLAGWQNSYDGRQFSMNEMRDWQSSSVSRVLLYAPQGVVEIGSGSGLMLFSIAPHCHFYHSMDASVEAVELTRQRLGSLSNVLCEHRPAHDLLVVDAAFDTVIVNSVIQYFPSIDYLVSVLKWATEAVDNGRIYFGDVRDLRLLEIFHADALHFRTNGHIPPSELASRSRETVMKERELVISPEFFANIPTLLPRITRVDVMLRDGCYENEMTRYRYDVVLHIENHNDVPMQAKEMDWQAEGLDLDSLSDSITVTDGTTLRLNIPNGRLRGVHDRVGAAFGRSAFGGRASSQSFWRRLEFRRHDLAPWRDSRSSLHLPKADITTFAEYANVPKAGEVPKPDLGRLFRPWLAERLPTYMVPAFFVELDAFPLTPNGKIDRKALPDPMSRVEVITKPATELERDVLTIWCDVLGHDRIDINDNFCEIGGDSLRVVRVQTELEKLLQRSILPAKLFEHYTIKGLAAYLSEPSQINS
ncbi:uncharacterized protein BDW70DRAFT_165012 [Aspergillus foveolatus]|uniref:uncharacterized protein n=1 Tax=Aspergillus foveolatus TaxID=210207 RepID=UPI003CCD30CF